MPGNNCRTCRFWKPPNEPWASATTNQRTCASPKVLKGYGMTGPPKDGMVVENDEGWALLTGPDFGCVNYEESGT